VSVALLIDGNSIVNRSFYALPLLSNKSGIYTNAAAGFFNVLLKHKNALNPEYIAVAFDRREPTFRHAKYEGYKAARKGMPDELACQMPYIKRILELMGIRTVEIAGYEADDIIGTLSRVFDVCHIATGDRDAFQLITDSVSVRLATNKDDVIYTPEKIREVYGVEPIRMIEVKALMGDSSDSIPGVPGIGEKTALNLIQKFGTVDYIYENLAALDITASVRNKLEKGKEQCYLSRELGTIALDAPVSLNIVDYAIGEGDTAELARLLGELEMASLMKKLNVNISAVPKTIPDEPRSDTDERLDEVLRDMEKVGVKLDVEGLTRFGEELKAGVADCEKRVYDAAGESFNIASPKQVGEILFEKLGLPGAKKTKTGYGFSTSSGVLDEIASMHPIIPLIVEYRELSKLYSTYVAGYIDKVADDGRIHTTFKNETRTGRLSSSEPNIQNIPVRTERGRVMRRFFTAESGSVLVDADYSQIELRVLARVANDAAMSEAFREGRDIHAATAASVFGVPEESVTREMRTAAKAVNFGIVYGMGAFSLSKDIGVSVADAKRYIERYLEKYEGVRDYLERTVAEAKKTGYVRTLTGRTRHIPEIVSPNKITMAAGERIAKNTPIQGTAADIIKIAMIGVHARLMRELPEAKLILQVHDELIVEAREADSERAAVILREEMSVAGKGFDMDLPVDVGVGKTWYESH